MEVWVNDPSSNTRRRVYTVEENQLKRSETVTLTAPRDVDGDVVAQTVQIPWTSIIQIVKK